MSLVYLLDAVPDCRVARVAQLGAQGVGPLEGLRYPEQGNYFKLNSKVAVQTDVRLYEWRTYRQSELEEDTVRKKTHH